MGSYCAGSRRQPRLELSCLESLLLTMTSYLAQGPCLLLQRRVLKGNAVFCFIWPSMGCKGKISTIDPVSCSPDPQGDSTCPLPPYPHACSPEACGAGPGWMQEVEYILRRVEITRFGLEYWHPVILVMCSGSRTLNCSWVSGVLSLKWRKWISALWGQSGIIYAQAGWPVKRCADAGWRCCSRPSHLLSSFLWNQQGVEMGRNPRHLASLLLLCEQTTSRD